MRTNAIIAHRPGASVQNIFRAMFWRMKRAIYHWQIPADTMLKVWKWNFNRQTPLRKKPGKDIDEVIPNGRRQPKTTRSRVELPATVSQRYLRDTGETGNKIGRQEYHQPPKFSGSADTSKVYGNTPAESYLWAVSDFQKGECSPFTFTTGASTPSLGCGAGAVLSRVSVSALGKPKIA